MLEHELRTRGRTQARTQGEIAREGSVKEAEIYEERLGAVGFLGEYNLALVHSGHLAFTHLFLDLTRTLIRKSIYLK